MDDLWPKDIEQPLEQKSPLSVLKKQAALLGSKTNNLVTAAVENSHNFRGAEFEYSFFILSAPLSYSYKLFTVTHDIGLYPVKIHAEKEILLEVADNMQIDISRTIFLELYSEEKLVIGLRNIFNSTKTKKVIGALLKLASGDEG